jgi:hypothetical protein
MDQMASAFTIMQPRSGYAFLIVFLWPIGQFGGFSHIETRIESASQNNPEITTYLTNFDRLNVPEGLIRLPETIGVPNACVQSSEDE